MSDKSTKDTKPNQNAKQNPKQNQTNNTNQIKPSKQEQKPSNDNTPPKQEQASQPVVATTAPSTTPQAQPAQSQQPQQPKPAVTKEKGRGNVKAVLSGDTIIVVHLEKNQQGPPLGK